MDAPVSTYDDIDGSSATWVLKKYVDFLEIDSLDKARQYVRDAKVEASPTDYMRVKDSILGRVVPVQKYSDIGALDSDYSEDSEYESDDSFDLNDEDMPYEVWRARARAHIDAKMALRSVRVPPPSNFRSEHRQKKEPMETFRLVIKGGARPEPPDDIDETDEYVSKLLQLADAYHDFMGIDVPEGKDLLTILETSVLGPGVHVLQPKMTLTDIANKDIFITAVTECDDFKFRLPDGSVHVAPNHFLKGRNLEAGVSPFSAGRTVGRKIGKVVNDELLTVEVFFRKTEKNKKLMVIDHVDKLRNSMKDFLGDPFEPEGRAPRLMVDQDMSPWMPDEAAHRHLFAWMTGFGHLVVAIDEHFKGVKPLTDIGFDFVYCDATVYDGARINNLKDAVHFSQDATGRVFHHKSVANVEFYEHTEPGTKRNSYAYKVTTTDPAKNPLASNFGETSITTTVRDGFIRNRVPRTREDNSKETMREDAEELIGHALNVAVPVTRKTAGDWGQVEHCKKHKMAFVTSDRLTALYAAYRDVPVLLVMHSEKGTSYVQYSFCMCGSEAARRRLTREPQAGGRLQASILNAVLAAVVVACAFV